MKSTKTRKATHDEQATNKHIRQSAHKKTTTITNTTHKHYKHTNHEQQASTQGNIQRKEIIHNTKNKQDIRTQTKTYEDANTTTTHTHERRFGETRIHIHKNLAKQDNQHTKTKHNTTIYTQKEHDINTNSKQT